MCERSNYFSRACDGQLVETFDQVIKLDEDPALVARMIQFIYTNDYDPPPTPITKNISSKTLDGELVIAEVEDAQAENEEEPHEPLPEEGQEDTADNQESELPAPRPLSFHISMYFLADRMGIEALKGLARRRVQQEMNDVVAQRDIDSFTKAIAEIFKAEPNTKTDRGLRDVAVTITIKHSKILCGELGDDLLDISPRFTRDIRKRIGM